MKIICVIQHGWLIKLCYLLFWQLRSPDFAEIASQPCCVERETAASAVWLQVNTMRNLHVILKSLLDINSKTEIIRLNTNNAKQYLKCKGIY